MSTARVRFLRKTYQQTRQFIEEDLESEGSSEDLDEAVTSVTSDTSDTAAQESGRRLSSLAKQLPRKEYLWRKVQAVAFGTRRAMQQRHRLLSTLKMSIQECVERQRVAKRIQETMMQDESGKDLLAGLRTSLDGTSIEMLEEILMEARKFQVLKLPDFVQMVLDHAMGDSDKAQQLLQDSLLDAVQDATELGEDLFEMDELRSNIMDKVEAFKIAMRKASESRIQDKLKSLEPPKEEESEEFLEAPEHRESHEREMFPAAPAESEQDGDLEDLEDLEEPGVSSAMSATSAVCAVPNVTPVAPEEPRQASRETLPAISNFDAAVASSHSSRDACDGRDVYIAHPDPPSSEGSYREPELLDSSEPMQAASSLQSESRSCRRGLREIPVKVQSARLPLQHRHHENMQGYAALVQGARQMASAEAESDLLAEDVFQTARSETTFRSTWHGKLMVLGPSTSERLATRAATSLTGEADRFPVLPMYRHSSKEAKGSDFRQKQKAVSLDNDLPKLGQIQPAGSWRSISKGSGRFGYTLPETPRREGPNHPLVSPRRNPPSHPAPRQMAWTLLPGITD